MANLIYSELKVKFVIHQKELVALFPTEIFKHGSDNISCYVRIGQHGEACRKLLNCRKAKPIEYYDLLKELQSIYEDKRDNHICILKVI